MDWEKSEYLIDMEGAVYTLCLKSGKERIGFSYE